MGDFARSMDYFHRTLVLKDELGDKKGIAAALKIIGRIKNSLKKYDEAIDYYFQALKISEEMEDRRAVAETMTFIGENLEKKGLHPQAIEYFRQSLEITEEINARAEKLSNYQQLVIAFASMKEMDSAALFLKLHHALSDSLTGELSSELSAVQVHLNSGDKDRHHEIVLYRRALYFAGFVILLLIGLLVFKQNRVNRNKV
jgi:tetratricopeptide (TPR) repeat protein